MSSRNHHPPPTPRRLVFSIERKSKSDTDRVVNFVRERFGWIWPTHVNVIECPNGYQVKFLPPEGFEMLFIRSTRPILFVVDIEPFAEAGSTI